MLSRLSAALLGAAFFCSALPVAARDWVAPNATLGRGAQVHQFVLVDPATGRAMPNARYRLFLPDHTIAGKPPQVSVRGVVDHAAQMVQVAVSDSGAGIPAEAMPRLFQPFFTMRPGGTGLGLAIVQKILVSHNGRVSAANGADGGGLFTLHLPIRPLRNGTET